MPLSCEASLRGELDVSLIPTHARNGRLRRAYQKRLEQPGLQRQPILDVQAHAAHLSLPVFIQQHQITVRSRYDRMKKIYSMVAGHLCFWIH